MVALGRADTRFKDLYDLWALLRAHKFEDEGLARAVRATFQRRRMAIPVTPPDALTPAFANDPMKRQQWASYTEDLESPDLDLSQAVADLAEFLMPHAEHAHSLP
jgi:hypothetical protein